MPNLTSSPSSHGAWAVAGRERPARAKGSRAEGQQHRLPLHRTHVLEACTQEPGPRPGSEGSPAPASGSLPRMPAAPKGRGKGHQREPRQTRVRARSE